MKVIKGIFNPDYTLQSKIECKIDDVFSGDDYNYEAHFYEDMVVLKDKLHEGVWYVIDNPDDAMIRRNLYEYHT